jgi:tetratricopeptide (TPR) repeat protein
VKAVLAILVSVQLLGACASATKTNPAAQRAEAGMQRAAQAYARGDLDAARRAYRDALRVYESVADADGRARARLSLARVEAAAGDAAGALASVESLLAEAGSLSPGLTILARGRAAALALGLGRVEPAGEWLQAARTACFGACPEHAALEVLEARRLLATGRADAALAHADGALAGLADDSADRADALRARAEALLSLGRGADAADAVGKALRLDQARGQADAVAADLTLLARAHEALGDTETAARFRTQAERASAARRALLGLEKTD